MTGVDLAQYCFPIETRDVFTKNGDYVLSKKYMSIHRQDSGKQISIVTRKYRIVRNEELISSLTETLDRTGFKYYLDDSHSFVQDHRMRLQLTFPELQLRDMESKIPLSLYVHNSYDYSEGVRIFWGAIRAICTNGMVFGKLLKRFYSKHTAHVSVEIIRAKFDEAYKEIPAINERIKLLEGMAVSEAIVTDLKKQLGPKINKEIRPEEAIGKISLWALYNLYTHYISHIVALQSRATYQQKLSKTFNL